MRRYLVTGGCGFIGSHLADALAAAGDGVRVLDNLSTGTAGFLPAGAELVVGDLADPCTAREATRDIDGCFHLAAVASVPRCNEAWLHSHRSNLSATIGLFEAATGAFGSRFPVVYASSAAVYGEQPELPLREELPARPRSPYGADKAACELHARAGAATRGLASVGLRLFNVYGPRQRPDSPYSGVISVFADRIGRGLPLAVHGDGGQTRDFVFVADVVLALLGAMRHLEGRAAAGQPPSEVLNVCTGEATTVGGLARRLMTLAGLAVPVTRGPPRDGDIRHAVGSPDRLARVVGVRPDTPLDEGLRRTLDRPAGEDARVAAARPPGPAPPGPAGAGSRARPPRDEGRHRPEPPTGLGVAPPP